MLVCICPLCKKQPASPTSCTMQPEHIDYTAHGGRIKGGEGGAHFSCLTWLSGSSGQYGPRWAGDPEQSGLHWAFPQPAGSPKSKTDLLSWRGRRGEEASTHTHTTNHSPRLICKHGTSPLVGLSYAASHAHIKNHATRFHLVGRRSME